MERHRHQRRRLTVVQSGDRVPAARDTVDEEDRAAPMAPAAETLKCVWSRHQAEHGASCRAHVPVSVALDAWRSEMEAMRRTEGFFRFSWRGGTWLAYGAPDGQVRGVYCATHSAEREGHFSAGEPAAATASA